MIAGSVCVCVCIRFGVMSLVNFLLCSSQYNRCDMFTKCKGYVMYQFQQILMVLLKMKRNGCMNGVTLQTFLLFSSNSKEGVAILFKNSFEFKIHDEIKDTLGNYIILDISIQDCGMAFHDQLQFMDLHPEFSKHFNYKLIFLPTHQSFQWEIGMKFKITIQTLLTISKKIIPTQN